jgi:nicotinate-nucleotide adenylyltransferase
VARAAAGRFVLDRVLFIPSARPPHRREGPFASYEDRFQMVSLACQEDPRFEASRLEAGPEISYSIDTIERVSRAFASKPLYFLLGADAFADLPTWHRHHDVIEAVTFIVVSRPSAQYRIPPGARVERLEDVSLAVSSSEIRRELALDHASTHIPPAVAEYIGTHSLYTARGDREPPPTEPRSIP